MKIMDVLSILSDVIDALSDIRYDEPELFEEIEKAETALYKYVKEKGDLK